MVRVSASLDNLQFRGHVNFLSSAAKPPKSRGIRVNGNARPVAPVRDTR